MNSIKRRDFFKIAASSGAAVALASCVKDPVEKILPAVFPPDNYIIGKSYSFASVCTECPAQCGISVTTREGRAIKIEGNPNHPLNQGKLCAIGQSSLQSLYNPNRIKKALVNGKETNLKIATENLSTKIKNLVDKGRGNEILFLGKSENSTQQQLITKLVTEIGAKQLFLDVNGNNSIKEANKILFGKYEIPEYNFKKANFLLNFGADFLESWLNILQNSRDFADFHTYKNKTKNEYFHISPHLSITGVKADKWINCPPKAETEIALALVNEIINSKSIGIAENITIKNYVSNYSLVKIAKKYKLKLKELKSLAKKLVLKRSLIIGGGNTNSNANQTELQIAIGLLNYITGNRALNFGANYHFGGNSFKEIVTEIKKLEKKDYSLVVAVDINLDYIFQIIPEWKKIKTPLVALSLTHNETTKLANLVIPISSSFESWGDSFIRNGIYALQQPVMAKLPNYETESVGEIFFGLAKKLQLNIDDLEAVNFKSYLVAKWKKIQLELNDSRLFVSFWTNSLKNGGIFKNYKPEIVNFQNTLPSNKKVEQNKGLSLLVLNSNLHSTNGETGDKYWLLETPHPLTQVVWDSWLEIHPDKAKELGINHADEIEISTPAGSTKLAAYIYNFIDKNTVAIPAGLGRTIKFPNYSSRRSSILPFKNHPKDSLINKKIGINPFELLQLNYDNYGELALSNEDIKIKKTGKKAFLVSLDGQYKDDIEALSADSPVEYGERSQKERHLIRSVSVKELRSGKIKKEGHQLRDRQYTTNTQNVSDFYKERRKNLNENIFNVQGNKTPKYYDPYKFEMVVDLDLCTGCSACIIACYAENNIAVVGKERQALGREMSWLRVERYFDKDKKSGKIKALLSPQMCQQCGNAGCEAVCPVYATYHNPDGLNAQIYNRCVGTRYCSNNCIYKQRRFNWRTYTFPEPLNLQLNPEVTVRDKGVMEKCTFCVQRIRKAKDAAKDQNRLIKDGELKTACQQTCPTNAIVFGNAVDENSAVSKLKKSLRGYHQLEELNFQPNVTYLSQVTQS